MSLLHFHATSTRGSGLWDELYAYVYVYESLMKVRDEIPRESEENNLAHLFGSFGSSVAGMCCVRSIESIHVNDLSVCEYHIDNRNSARILTLRQNRTLRCVSGIAGQNISECSALTPV